MATSVHIAIDKWVVMINDNMSEEDIIINDVLIKGVFPGVPKGCLLVYNSKKVKPK